MLSLEEKVQTLWSAFPDLPLQLGAFSVYLPQPQQHQLRQAIKWWVTVLISPSAQFWLDYIEQQTHFTMSALGGLSLSPAPGTVSLYGTSSHPDLQTMGPPHTPKQLRQWLCLFHQGPSAPQLHVRDTTHFFLRRMTTEKALTGRKGGWHHTPGNVCMTDTGHPKLALCDNLGGGERGGRGLRMEVIAVCLWPVHADVR